MLTILYHGAVLFEHLVKQSKIKIKISLYHFERFSWWIRLMWRTMLEYLLNLSPQ